jgi:hypothetical protein
MRRTGAVEEPLTGGHFLTYRAEASSSANGWSGGSRSAIEFFRLNVVAEVLIF